VLPLDNQTQGVQQDQTRREQRFFGEAAFRSQAAFSFDPVAALPLGKVRGQLRDNGKELTDFKLVSGRQSFTREQRKGGGQ
jgi:hypothetical protein